MEFAIVRQLRQVDYNAQTEQPGAKAAAESAKGIGQQQQLQSVIQQQETVQNGAG
ncbi:hypothetical protein OC498_08030 [Acinetobacter bohemicus]|uniref:hypothetical protein n=1 Tax=Acinetobacter TaxID=469 RepID=UPI00209AAC46|nr:MULTISPECIES: hypothetical protein [Acinetobacter]MCO8042685.1 hypothetical protein [Acinetobacter sp. S4400-12]MCU7224850.1 hypothetical protein [Acinetobacter bohemicus]